MLRIECKEPLSRKPQAGDRQFDQVAWAPARMRDIGRHRDIVPAGSQADACHVLVTGLACSYRLLGSGQRQITAIHIPGDLVDFASFVSPVECAATALSPAKIISIPHEMLRAAMSLNPELAESLMAHAMIDAAIQRERLISLGRRHALASLAHLLCELLTRFQRIGIADGNTYHLPMTQAELGDVLGLSTVHVNRTIQQLREQELITWGGDTVSLHEPEKLKQLAEFDAPYLQVRPGMRHMTALDAILSGIGAQSGSAAA